MECPFPGDLLSQFKGLRGLYAGWNSFTVSRQDRDDACAGGAGAGASVLGKRAAARSQPPTLNASPQSNPPSLRQGDVNEAAASLASLPDLQELGLFGNSLSGELREGGQVCGLVQAGRLEMLQLGGQTPGGLTGGLPACLFNGASRLYQFSAASNRLAGSLPDAFAGAANLQLLNVASNSLTGVIPRSLADAPALTVLDLVGGWVGGRSVANAAAHQPVEPLHPCTLPPVFLSPPPTPPLMQSNNSLGGSIPAFKSLKLSGLDLVGGWVAGASARVGGLGWWACPQRSTPQALVSLRGYLFTYTVKYAAPPSP